MVRLVLVAVAVTAGCAAPAPASQAPAQAPSTVVEANATVVRVVDGDTVTVEVGGRDETVRLIGIDTPETVKPESPVECFGPEASSFTAQLLPQGTPVRLVRDVEARDQYGRLLAYLYRATDNAFVNLLIVERGYGTLLTFPPNVAHVDDLVAAARAAQRAGLGLWGRCTG